MRFAEIESALLLNCTFNPPISGGSGGLTPITVTGNSVLTANSEVCIVATTFVTLTLPTTIPDRAKIHIYDETGFGFRLAQNAGQSLWPTSQDDRTTIGINGFIQTSGLYTQNAMLELFCISPNAICMVKEFGYFERG